jgi:hypothetical protein
MDRIRHNTGGHRVKLILPIVALLILGCDQSSTTPVTSDPATQPPATDLPPAPKASEVKVEYDTRIETIGEKSTVHWSARVPTGGWTMTLDQPPLVEERNALVWARVYVTIEAPGTDEIVTQAFETLEGRHEANRKVDRVELSARRKVRGQASDFAPAYVVVRKDGEGAAGQGNTGQ